MFPNGIIHYIAGGVIIGLALSLIYVITGIQAGASGWFSSIWSNITKSTLGKTRSWRTIFTVTTILGGYIYAIIFNDFFTTSLSPITLLVGGFLIGIGMRAASGCTSGHGICGVSAGYLSSIYFTIIIVVTAILTRLLL